MLCNCSASSQADPMRWRSSGRARGQQQVSRGQHFGIARGIEPGYSPGMDDFGQSDSEQVQVVPFKRVEQRAIVSSLFDQRMRAQPAHITMLLGAS